jgi:hypothetical protein
MAPHSSLDYPVNVGRNIAREAANSYFIFPSDIELYPNPGLIPDFLDMIRRNEKYLVNGHCWPGFCNPKWAKLLMLLTNSNIDIQITNNQTGDKMTENVYFI